MKASPNDFQVALYWAKVDQLIGRGLCAAVDLKCADDELYGCPSYHLTEIAFLEMVPGSTVTGSSGVQKTGAAQNEPEVSDDSMNSIELVPHASEFCTFSLQTIEDGNHEEADLAAAAAVSEGQVFCTQHGDFQVVHATAEQIAQIQQTHQIQILNGNHILATAVDGSSDDNPTLAIIP